MRLFHFRVPSLTGAFLALVSCGCAPDIEPHRFDATLRCESPSDDTFMTTDVSAHFEDGKLRRKETLIEPEGVVGPDGAIVVAIGTRKEGITSYGLTFPLETLESAQRFRDEPLVFSSGVRCSVAAADVGTHPDNAETVTCESVDASCTVRAWTTEDNGSGLRL